MKSITIPVPTKSKDVVEVGKDTAKLLNNQRKKATKALGRSLSKFGDYLSR